MYEAIRRASQYRLVAAESGFCASGPALRGVRARGSEPRNRTPEECLPPAYPPLDNPGFSHHLARPAMPKMKTNKAAAKRFRVSGKGRVRRPKAGGNHGMQEKSRKRLRRLRKNDMVDSTMERHVKRLLPYG
jgi:large subunit ribosomal protein L35